LPPSRTRSPAADGLTLAGSGRTLEDGIDLASRVDVLVCDIQLAGHAEGLQVLDAARALPKAACRPARLRVRPRVRHAGRDRPRRRRLPRQGLGGRGDRRRDPRGCRRVARSSGRPTSTPLARRPAGPTGRELEVIARVVAGSTNAEVAAELGLSEKTVETHLHRLFDRYGLVSRTELAVLAIDEGWATRP
jgi:DNA-binding NarL/FixJ family response regulator